MQPGAHTLPIGLMIASMPAPVIDDHVLDMPPLAHLHACKVISAHLLRDGRGC